MTTSATVADGQVVVGFDRDKLEKLLKTEERGDEPTLKELISRFQTQLRRPFGHARPANSRSARDSRDLLLTAASKRLAPIRGQSVGHAHPDRVQHSSLRACRQRPQRGRCGHHNSWLWKLSRIDACRESRPRATNQQSF